MLRAIQLVLAGAVLAVAALAAVGLTRNPEAGVTPEEPGGIVTKIDPGSPAWRGGVRPGDQVVELHASDEAGGWRLITTDGDTTRITEAAVYRATHAWHVGWAIVGLLVAFVAAAIAFRAAPLAAVTTPLALAFAAQPLFFAGSVLATALGGVAVFFGGSLAGLAFAPGARRSSFGRRTWRQQVSWALAAVGVVLGGAWLVSLLTTSEVFDVLDALRWPVAFGYATIGGVMILDRDRLRASRLGPTGPTFVDVAYVAVVGAVLFLAAVSLRVELLLVAFIGALAAVAYPYWRQVLLEGFDRLVTADIRREATIRATEEERGRVARDLHDSAIQQLAVAVRRLEGAPGNEDGVQVLRDVSTSLREVAGSLHPPVLEDLGLAAAIEDVADAYDDERIKVDVVQASDSAGPPRDVGLAAYRVAQGAISNAIGHANANRITVTGVVGANDVHLEIADDGAGYGLDDVRTARSAGHFGLDVMRERADAVHARLTTESGPRGTTVSFDWEGRR